MNTVFFSVLYCTLLYSFRLALCPLQHCVPMSGLISVVFSLGEKSECNLCGQELSPPAKCGDMHTFSWSSALPHLHTFMAIMITSSPSYLGNISVCNWRDHTQLGNDWTSVQFPSNETYARMTEAKWICKNRNCPGWLFSCAFSGPTNSSARPFKSDLELV